MKLDAPITIKPPIQTFGPVYKRPDGRPLLRDTITFTEFKLTIIDDVAAKFVKVRIEGVPLHIVLWSGDLYDAIGDYTQTQVEQRLLEVLGDEPAVTLIKYFTAALPEY